MSEPVIKPASNRRWRALLVVLAAGALCACSEASSASKKESPVSLNSVAGSDVKEVVLTQRAVERIGLEMGKVSESSGSKKVPYAAVVYDKLGKTWVYSSPKDLTFVRTPITVSEIRGDEALLTTGPAAGTPVVTVGNAELFGAELGIGY